jgi:adenylate cyclase
MMAVSASDAGSKLEYRFYDTLLGIKPGVTERKDVLLIDIDDPAIEQIGAWPWSRDIMADALIRLREAGGKTAVFDIEYLSPGQAGVNRTYVKNEFPSEYKGVHDEVLQYLQDFTGAIASRNIPLSFVNETGSEMAGYVDQRMNDLQGSITANIFRDNDLYFAKGLKFFGHAYLTINSAQINTNAEMAEVIKYAQEHILLKNVEDKGGLIPRDNLRTLKDNLNNKGIAPAILPLISNASGGGFPNVVIDDDGVRRRIELLVEHDGEYVAQLVFAPILDVLKPEKIIRHGRRLTLVNALDPAKPESGVRRDITIPLDENGRLLINWLKTNFIDDDEKKSSFSHISFYALKNADEVEEKLLDNLASIESLGIKNASGYLSYHDAVVYLRANWADLQKWKTGLLDGTRDDYDAYFDARSSFFADYGQFLDGGYDTEIYETFDKVSAATGKSEYTELKTRIKSNFDIYRSDYKTYMELRTTLSKICTDKFCIIGYTGVGTSDLGTNPFWNKYPNVGTHANIYNTIMTGEFITPVPLWFSWFVALVFGLLAALAFRRIKSLKGRISFGVAATIFTFLGITAVFVFFRVYVQMLVPFFTVLIAFIAITILKFFFSEQEKSFLRKAFTMYLSSDVVNQIVANPSLLKLGGQEKQITALFTDIKSFSTLSEKVTPEHLVQILNRYLTVMSDIVLAEKGTIDKYIGDAIVSFFGAPLDLPDHAEKACLAAVRMKEAEDRLNEEFKAAGDVPMEIHTRIGINTGAMVVGNMGTDNKMNYTIMGNDVNLAARLEGVNKQYGTWILVSESTWNASGGKFLGRKLDRVRVVGINTPVQLYNIVAVRAEASGSTVAFVEKFNQAVDAYREKRFSDSLILFTKCAELNPDDAATKVFLDRVKDLMKTGVPEDWSDVINMTTK